MVQLLRGQTYQLGQSINPNENRILEYSRTTVRIHPRPTDPGSIRELNDILQLFNYIHK